MSAPVPGGPPLRRGSVALGLAPLAAAWRFDADLELRLEPAAGVLCNLDDEARRSVSKRRQAH